MCYGDPYMAPDNPLEPEPLSPEEVEAAAAPVTPIPWDIAWPDDMEEEEDVVID